MKNCRNYAKDWNILKKTKDVETGLVQRKLSETWGSKVKNKNDITISYEDSVYKMKYN
jgi:hypothetical protein